MIRIMQCYLYRKKNLKGKKFNLHWTNLAFKVMSKQ